MKTLVKTSLALVASLILLLGCSKQASTPASSSTKEDKTTQSSETKQSSQQSSEKKDETKNYIFVHNSNPGRTSTLTYTVKGDDVVKQEVYNVFDPEILDKSAEEIKELIVKTYKKEEGLKGITQNIEFKDEKVIQNIEVDMSVASLDELKKAMPNEYYGIGNRVSFAASKKKLKEAGYTEQTN